MQNEVISLLSIRKSEESINLLCQTANLLPYQAERLIDLYQNYVASIRNMRGLDTSILEEQREKLVSDICNGYYSTEEAKKSDLRSAIGEGLAYHQIDKLCALTSLDEATITDYCEQYSSLSNDRVEILKKGLDASFFDEKITALVDELCSSLDKSITR